jgi:hypothetical protein
VLSRQVDAAMDGGRPGALMVSDILDRHSIKRIRFRDLCAPGAPPDRLSPQPPNLGLANARPSHILHAGSEGTGADRHPAVRAGKPKFNRSADYSVVPVVAAQLWRRAILNSGGEAALARTLKGPISLTGGRPCANHS